jgi:flagellar biosynthetic protein FliO
MKGMNAIWTALLLMLLALGSTVAAEDGVTNQTGPPAAIQTSNSDGEQEKIPSLTESVLPSLSRIAISLGVIVVIIYLTVFLLRKLSGNRIGGKKGNKIRIVEQAYLAPKKSVCLLKLADRAVLIGITDTKINLLTEFDWESMPEELTDKEGGIQAGFPGFLNEAAGRLFGGKKSKGADRVPAA